MKIFATSTIAATLSTFLALSRYTQARNLRAPPTLQGAVTVSDLLLDNEYEEKTSGGGSLLVDTDADVDDIGAIMYLLANTGSSLRGVTVEADGWSNQWSGLINIQRTMQQFGCNNVELAYGVTPGYTILGGNENGQPTTLSGFDGAHYPNLPDQEYLKPIDSIFTSGCTGFRWAVNPTAAWPYGSTNLLRNAIKSDPGNTDLVLLGPYSNIAALLQQDPTIIQDIRSVTVSGGYLAWDTQNDEAPYSYSDLKPHDSGQNFELDPNAASFFYAALAKCQQDIAIPKEDRISGYWYPKSCPRVQLITSSAQHELPLATDEENSRLCGKGCKDSYLGEDILSYYDSLDNCLNETDIYYWDQSAAVLSQHSEFCNEWIEEEITVVLESGPAFGTIQNLKDSNGATVKICNKVDRDLFLDLYWSPFREGVSTDGEYCLESQPVPIALMTTSS